MDDHQTISATGLAALFGVSDRVIREHTCVYRKPYPGYQVTESAKLAQW
jgi:hypothetical protein